MNSGDLIVILGEGTLPVIWPANGFVGCPAELLEALGVLFFQYRSLLQKDCKVLIIIE